MRILSTPTVEAKNRVYSSHPSGAVTTNKIAQTDTLVNVSLFNYYIGNATQISTVPLARSTFLDVNGKGFLTYILAPRENYGSDIQEVWVTVDGVEYYFTNNDEDWNFAYWWSLSFNVPPITRNYGSVGLVKSADCLVMDWGLKFNHSLKIEFATNQTAISTSSVSDHLFIGYHIVDDFDNQYYPTDSYKKHERLRTL